MQANQAKTAGKQPKSQPESPGGDLGIYVLETSGEATASALETACALARGLEATIHLLSLQRVSYALPLNRPPVQMSFQVGRLQALVARVQSRLAAPSPTVRIEAHTCRDEYVTLQNLLTRGAVVVIGQKPSGFRWPSLLNASNRLARRLTKLGFQVIRAQASGPIGVTHA